MFLLSIGLIALIVVPVAIVPELGNQLLGAVLDFLSGQFGWLYLWFAVTVTGLLIWLAFSRYGHIKFGAPNDKPQFSTASWISMIFTAGIGGGLMYWGVIEWAFYYNEPPMGAEPRSIEAANWATAYPLFHWGPTAWALFCLPALALTYVYHVRKQPTLRLSDACRGVIGNHADGWLGRVIDVLFMFGMVGAAGTSLGLEVPVVSESIGSVLGVERGTVLDIAVIAIWTTLFGGSVFLGIHKGLKRLANFNLWLAGVLGLFIVILGPTLFIIDSFTNSVGVVFQNVIQMSFYTDPVGGSGFEEDWTIFYWGWWIAYAPFVGLFVAKISKGRTIRGMIGAMCIGGTLGCWLGFGLLGNTALFYQINDIVPVADLVEDQGEAPAIMAAVSALPLGGIALLAFVLLLVVFLATTLDSAAYTMAAAASKELPRDQEPPRWQRILWAVVLAVVSIALMYAGGLETLQTLSIITAFPLIFVLLTVLVSFRRWLIEDVERSASQTIHLTHEAADETHEVAHGMHEAVSDSEEPEKEKATESPT